MGKRVLVCMVLGFIAGFVCWFGFEYSGRMPLTTPLIVSILLNRALLGFLIGVSSLRVNWFLEGLLFGLAASLPFAVLSFGTAQGLGNFLTFEGAGAVYGIVIALGGWIAGGPKR